jgi:hypothetical protein
MTVYHKEMLSFSDKERVENMPVNPESMSSRYGLTNFPVYKDFCSFFVSGVVGIRHFDRNKCIQPLSKYVTSSDEAFAVLTLENNWSRWSSMARTKSWKDSEVPSAWTTSIDKRKSKDDQEEDESGDEAETPQARRYRGWTAKGILRYNQLHADVMVKRELKEFKDFEKYCLEEFQAEAERLGKNINKRKRREPDRPLPMATHNLWDDVNLDEDTEQEGVARLLPAGMQGVGV